MSSAAAPVQSFSAERPKSSAEVPIIQRLSRKLSKKGSSLSVFELKQLLDDLRGQLQPMTDHQQRLAYLNEILTGLFSVTPTILISTIGHPFFNHLRTNFIRLLEQWNHESRLNEAELFLFWNLNKLFRIFLEHTPSVDTFLTNTTDPALLRQISVTLTNLSASRKFSDEKELKLFSNLLNLIVGCQELMVSEKSTKMDAFNVLIEPASQCLSSPHVVDSFLALTSESRRMTVKEKLYLVRIPNLLISYHGSQRPSMLYRFLSTTLVEYERLFGQLLESIHQWSRAVVRGVNQTIRLFEHACTDSTKTMQLFTNHLGLIDRILDIIASPTMLEKAEETKYNAKISLLENSMTLLITLIHQPIVVERIQAQKLSDIFVQLQSTSHPKLVQLSTTLLASTAREEDMKSIKDPSSLLRTVVDSLKESLESDSNTKSHSSLDEAFETLKGLAQYDPMKEEIQKQDLLPFLLECVNKVAEQSLVLLFETLWSLSFSNDAALVLRQHQDFLDRIQEMSTKTNDERLEKATQGLVWKLIQEPKMLEQAAKREQDMETTTVMTTEEVIGEDGQKKLVTKKVERPAMEKTFEYDMMISYCHADKDLVYKIHQFLVDEGFKVWIDLNNMHGPAMSAMAEAVENSEFIIMCMSESYKKSTYCQAEAEYAFNCKRRIVPLIVRPQYRADGWLGFLIGSRIYIDFGRFDFPTACEKLMNEIRLQLQRPMPSKEKRMGQHEIPSKKDPPPPEAAAPTPKPAKTVSEQYSQRKPKFFFRQRPIDLWTDSDVLDFLAFQQLHELMPVCEKMDGKALLQLHKMCSSRHNRTYQILRDELRSVHQLKLPISTYTRFLSVMEKFERPPTVSQHRQVPSPAPPAPVILKKPYDILVTSNAPHDQMINMVQSILPKLSSSNVIRLYP